LEEQGLIRSSKSFKVYLLIHGWANKLQPGVYQIAYGSDASTIAKTLVAGMPAEKPLLFQKDTRFWILKKIKKEEILGDGESTSYFVK